MHDIIKPRRDAEKLSTPNGRLRVGKVEKVSKYHGLAKQQKAQSATFIIIIEPMFTIKTFILFLLLLVPR